MQLMNQYCNLLVWVRNELVRFSWQMYWSVYARSVLFFVICVHLAVFHILDSTLDDSAFELPRYKYSLFDALLFGSGSIGVA